MEKTIRILNIVPNMRSAGIETFIMNVYRNIDRKKIQFDFLVHNKEEEFYDAEIKKLGGKIYRFSLKDDKNIFKYIKDLNRFFKEHKEYKIIHGHMQSMMPLYLYFAKKNDIPIRIAHSHNNSYEKSLKGIVLHIFSRFSKYFSTVNLACSKESGKYLFGKREFEVINNGIDLKKFKFNKEKRKEIRKKLGIQKNEILIGNIGRMEKQKNQKFLIDVFNDSYIQKNNVKLLIIGTGSLEENLKQYAKVLKIDNKVIFLKNIKNVNDYMQAMDMFLLPSLYEGLGIVLIEAQMSGLYCLTTEGTVAIETKITPNIKYLNLDKKLWTDEVVKYKANDRKIIINNLIEQFDISNVASTLQKKYYYYYKNRLR